MATLLFNESGVWGAFRHNFETVIAKQPILRLLDPSSIEFVIAVGPGGRSAPATTAEAVSPVMQWFRGDRGWLAMIILLVCGSVVGFDFVEVNPPLDVGTGVTSYLGALTVAMFLGYIDEARRSR